MKVMLRVALVGAMTLLCAGSAISQATDEIEHWQERYFNALSGILRVNEVQKQKFDESPLGPAHTTVIEQIAEAVNAESGARLGPVQLEQLRRGIDSDLRRALEGPHSSPDMKAFRQQLQSEFEKDIAAGMQLETLKRTVLWYESPPGRKMVEASVEMTPLLTDAIAEIRRHTSNGHPMRVLSETDGDLLSSLTIVFSHQIVMLAGTALAQSNGDKSAAAGVSIVFAAAMNVSWDSLKPIWLRISEAERKAISEWIKTADARAELLAVEQATTAMTAKALANERGATVQNLMEVLTKLNEEWKERARQMTRNAR